MNNRYRHIVGALFFMMTVSVTAGQLTASDASSLITALHESKKNDTIVLRGGMYEINFTISKTIAVIGIDNPIVRGNGNESVITVTADSCTIANITIEQTGRDLLYEHAGILLLSDGNTVRQTIIRNTLFGIYIKQSDRNNILHNTISSFKDIDQGQRGSGIHVWNSHWNTLTGNTISYSRDGIYIQNANNTMITDNEVHSLRYGLHYMYADSNTFLRNSFHDNVAGAAVMYTHYIVMKHNVFYRNRGFASYGLLLQDCHHSVADSNVIVDNVTGLFMEASTDNVFSNNIIAQNDFALQMYQNSIKNVFTRNHFIDNLNPLTLVGKRTESHWHHEKAGNYWSSYEGYDLDGDGIGDIPMRIQNVFNFLEGKNSNVRLYLYSPASQALAAAAKAFPIIDINNEIDEFPLISPSSLTWAYAMLPNISTQSEQTQENGTVVTMYSMALFFSVTITVIQWKRRRNHRAAH